MFGHRLYKKDRVKIWFRLNDRERPDRAATDAK